MGIFILESPFGGYNIEALVHNTIEIELTVQAIALKLIWNSEMDRHPRVDISLHISYPYHPSVVIVERKTA